MDGLHSEPPPERRLGAVLGRQHGVVSRRQLRALGLSEDTVDARVRKGVLLRVERGVYSAGHVRLSDEGRLMAAVLARGAGAVLSHRSAGALWGIWRSGSPVVDVTVARPGGPASRGMVIVHRCAALDPADVTRKRGIPVTRPARTLLDLAEVVPTRALEQALDDAERLGLCSEKQLHRVIARSPGRIGGSRLGFVLADHAAGTTATVNDFEELFFALCREHGIPDPLVNTRLGPYRPDFIWHEARVIVETDGRATHGTRRAFEEDRARDAELTTAGWRVLRFTWRQLEQKRAWVANMVLKLLSLP
jgi:very-short-patch-repair endonuclease